MHQVDDYHGTKICDPYAWLEDTDSAETVVCDDLLQTFEAVSFPVMLHIYPHSSFKFQAFVEEQNKLTMPYLEQCAVRPKFHQRLTELYDYPKYSCPYKRGKRYYLKYKEDKLYSLENN